MSGDLTGSVEEFFNRLAASPQPLLQNDDGTVRIDVAEDSTVQHWLMHIDHGRVQVSHRNVRADAVLSADQALFERLVRGEANALTAGLRGQLGMQGDMRLAVAFRRLLPSPPGGRTTLPPEDRESTEAARAAKAAGTTTRTAKASTAVASMTRKDRAR